MLEEQRSLCVKRRGQAGMAVLVCVLGVCVRGCVGTALPQGGIQTQTSRVHQYLREGACCRSSEHCPALCGP